MRKPSFFKNTGDLTYGDFADHPLWTFYDYDEGDEMVPIDYPNWRSEAIGVDTLLAICSFVLHDGTIVPGVVGININTERPVTFEFPDAEGKLVTFSVNNWLETGESRNELARILGKTMEQVYPIRYTTPFILENGHLLSGSHD